MAAEASQEIHLPATGLLLVGMGMGRLEGMTHEALQAASAAEHRRYEAYTALWPEEEIARLEARIGAIQRVMRPEVEEPDELLALASTSLVALLVVGDPLQATTHVDLQLRAAEAGVECRVFHGLSITTLVTGAVGLSNYKFGRQTTLTYPYGGWIATSPLRSWPSTGRKTSTPLRCSTSTRRAKEPRTATDDARRCCQRHAIDVDETQRC